MSSFSIEIGDYLARATGNPVEDAMLAELTIRARDFLATEVEDLKAKTVRQKIYVSVYDLAQWFAANWWRLRWEPEKSTGPSWAMSHHIGAAGGGYLGPDLAFISDGAVVTMKSKPSPPSSPEPLRFLNDKDVSIPATKFEREADNFINKVIGRLTDGIKTDKLIELWREVQKERRDPGLAAWRKMEALLGFDPGDAPDAFIESLQSLSADLGQGSVEELAAASGEKVLDDVRFLREDARKCAFDARIPSLTTLLDRLKAEMEPSPYAWQRATQAARIAREEWAVGQEAVSSKKLSDIFGIAPKFLSGADNQAGPMSAGFRNGAQDSVKVFLKSPYSTNRRFALMRLVGDHLTASIEDKTLPVLGSKTQRQKFQRAFAQEFLCPYNALKAFEDQLDLSDDDELEKTCQHFEVSQQVIKTIWVNKGAAGSERFADELRC